MLLLNPLMVINMSPFSTLDGFVLHSLLQQCQLFHMLCLCPWLSLQFYPAVLFPRLAVSAPPESWANTKALPAMLHVWALRASWKAQKPRGPNGTVMQHCTGCCCNGLGRMCSPWGNPDWGKHEGVGEGEAWVVLQLAEVARPVQLSPGRKEFEKASPG